MKEAIVSKGPVVQIIESPIPEPQAGQVRIKVVISGSNPKDWKGGYYRPGDGPMNQGDDMGGFVDAVGAGVVAFRPGDRVAACHEVWTTQGSYAEYAIAWAYMTFHISEKTSFEEAAAIPLAYLTAAVGLYRRLGLPFPWTPATEPLPLVIYGASSAVGMYALQLALRCNIHPLLCVAGRTGDRVRALIDRSRGDVVVDYRDGDEAVVRALRDAAAKGGGGVVCHALDCVGDKTSVENVCKVLWSPGQEQQQQQQQGKKEEAKAWLATVLPIMDADAVPAHVETSVSGVDWVWLDERGRDFGLVMCAYVARALEQGCFHGQTQEVMPGGLGGVQTALEKLKAGSASAVKYVFRIAETEGVEK